MRLLGYSQRDDDRGSCLENITVTKILNPAPGRTHLQHPREDCYHGFDAVPGAYLRVLRLGQRRMENEKRKRLGGETFRNSWTDADTQGGGERHALLDWID
ncbi:hypothetical protein BC834DRAFT_368497 [Gloeopeniophorella convolvens]|nr:hypothetical protein BC834DRAFT_368497 [Gloeopeniophorella convolvens]